MSTVYRIHWMPGTDRLLAVCHCGSWREVDDPVAAWEWLVAHPAGHTGGDRPEVRPSVIYAGSSSSPSRGEHCLNRF